MLTYDQALTRALKVARRKYERLVADDEYGSFHRSHHAAEALERAEEWLEKHGHDFTFGVEGMSVPENDFSSSSYQLSYLNAGDTYASTLLWDGKSEEFSIGCWGDWLEEAEHAYMDDMATYACGYCGAFTPLTEGVDWHETVCGSCGWYVDGSRLAPVVHAEEEED